MKEIGMKNLLIIILVKQNNLILIPLAQLPMGFFNSYQLKRLINIYQYGRTIFILIP
jgi:hypothetical protein